jgi:hypothetical protein
MHDGLENVEKLGFEPIMVVHDEIVSICEPYASQEKYDSALCELAPWATDIPIVAEGSMVERYTK